MRFRLVIKYSVICIRAYLYGGNISMKKKAESVKKIWFVLWRQRRGSVRQRKSPLAVRTRGNGSEGRLDLFYEFYKKKKKRDLY